MKLFVSGESSPDPDQWARRPALIIASSAEEALELSDYSIVTEIPMDKPTLLI